MKKLEEKLERILWYEKRIKELSNRYIAITDVYGVVYYAIEKQDLDAFIQEVESELEKLKNG